MSKAKKYRKRLLTFGLILLLFPMLELVTPMRVAGGVSRESLNSTIEPLTWETFFNGTFQESLTDYVNDQIGLFAFFVKLHNQLEYSLFGNIYTGEVVAGKENYLFEQAYIDTYYGNDFLGMNRIERFADVFKELQDSLAARGKIAVFAMATGKASYYPEYLPEQKAKDSTNYQYFKQEFDKRGVNYLDYRPYFMELKKTYGDLLFPKYGIHWSHFSNVFVADTLVKYIEAKTNWDLPHIQIDSIHYTDEPRYYDNDIAGSMNLFQELKPDSLAYPEFSWEPKTGKSPKKILFISDSFGWDLFENMRIGYECFDDMHFWYYNYEAHDTRLDEGRVKNSLPLLTRHVNLRKALNDFDAFVVLANEPNTYLRGWRFPKQALLTLKNPDFIPEFIGDEYLEEQCYTKAGWREVLEKMAEERGISFEEMVDIYLHDRNFEL